MQDGVLAEIEAAIDRAESAQRTCAACKGVGWLRNDAPYGHSNFGKLVKCGCLQAVERVRRRRNIMERSGLGQVRGKMFQGFNTRVPGVQEAYKAAYAYARQPSGWLVLLGPVGCGKTHLAAAIANTCFDQHDMGVMFATVADLLDYLRATFDTATASGITYDEQFSRLREADLLVLDDLGAQYTTEWANEKLFQLLNYRYTQANIIDTQTGWSRGATVITSNLLNLNGVAESIRSRLWDTRIAEVVHFGERVHDYRPFMAGSSKRSPQLVQAASGEGK
jgi:DNA replication protein DnaC